MKIATSFLAGLLLIGTLGASDTAMAAGLSTSNRILQAVTVT